VGCWRPRSGAQSGPSAAPRSPKSERQNTRGGPTPEISKLRSQRYRTKALDHDAWTRKALKLRETLKGLPKEDRIELIKSLPEKVRRKFLNSPYYLGRDKQVEALTSDADTILVLCGRGWGKNFVGSHWLLDRIERGHRATAAVAETAADVRDDVVDPAEKGSGILDFAEKRQLKPNHKISQSRVELKAPHGPARIQLFSGDSPRSLRGFSGSAAWIDEIGKMRYQDSVKEQIDLTLREGGELGSQLLITTTPRPTDTIKELVEDDSVHVIHGSSWENEANLSGRMIRRLEKIEDTDRGRQEVHAEILDGAGDLWDYDDIDHVTPSDVPELVRIVIGLDPSISDDEGDECGIVVCGKDAEDTAYVLCDASGQYNTRTWGALTVALYHGRLERARKELDDLSPIKPLLESGYDWPPADRIEAEQNQGGDLVKNQIQSFDTQVAVNGLHVQRSKRARAEPVHTLFQSGDVVHVGTHPGLEDQMVDFLQDGEDEDDRVDALVHSITELLLPNSTSNLDSDHIITLD